jgi:hypothetical protein
MFVVRMLLWTPCSLECFLQYITAYRYPGGQVRWHWEAHTAAALCLYSVSDTVLASGGRDGMLHGSIQAHFFLILFFILVISFPRCQYGICLATNQPQCAPLSTREQSMYACIRVYVLSFVFLDHFIGSTHIGTHILRKCVAGTVDSSTVVTGCADKLVRVIRVASSATVAELCGHTGSIEVLHCPHHLNVHLEL